MSSSRRLVITITVAQGDDLALRRLLLGGQREQRLQPRSLNHLLRVPNLSSLELLERTAQHTYNASLQMWTARGLLRTRRQRAVRLSAGRNRILLLGRK